MEQNLIKTQKAACRREAREAALSLGREYRRKASSAICGVLSRFVEDVEIRRVFCYFGCEPEVLTREFLEYCLCKDIPLYIPLCVKGRNLEFYRISCLDMREGFMGIPEPEPSGVPALPVEGDLVVVPGLAFGRDGTRLGHGAGYYDHFLPACRAKKIGLCFDSVLFDSLPHDMYDIPVDMLITETEVTSVNDC